MEVNVQDKWTDKKIEVEGKSLNKLKHFDLEMCFWA